MRYEEIPSGKELDELVAEKVMGWSNWSQPNSEYCNSIDEIGYNWSPSSNLNHAWEVVKIMNEFLHLREFPPAGNWEAYFSKGERLVSKATGETAPLAICRAALMMVE